MTKRILILGGTGFIGPEQVKYAVERGHDVTLFNRGSNKTMFPGLKALQGDRNVDGAVDVLKGKTWDFVIDNHSPGSMKWVIDATNVLKGSIGQYIFVSTTGVYADSAHVEPSEDSPLLPLLDTTNDAEVRSSDRGQYSARKATCEKIARDTLGADKVTVIRPGLIVGPGDVSDRFTYWPWRIEKGGEVLAPGNFDDPVQWIDVRDLTQFMVRCGENGTTGIFNAAGPIVPCGIAGLLYGIKSCFSNDATFTWASQQFLSANKVRSWAEMPVWSFKGTSTYAFCTTKNDKAKSAGLTFRSLADTVNAAMTWYHSKPAADQEKLRAGMTLEREKELLALWHSSGQK